MLARTGGTMQKLTTEATRTRIRMICAALAILLVSAIPTQAEAAQWEPTLVPPFDGAQVNLVDSAATAFYSSTINIMRQGPGGLSSCNGFGVAPCDAATADKYQFGYGALLLMPMCTATSVTYCVSEMSVYKSGTDPTPAKFLGETPGPKVRAQSDFGLPAGGGVLLFDAPTTPNAAGTTTYAVHAFLHLMYDRPANTFVYGNFAVSVQPYSTVATSRPAAKLVPIPSAQPMPPGVPSPADRWLPNEWTVDRGSSHAWSGDYVDGITEDFSDGTRVSVKLRMPKETGAWFSARLQDPQVSLDDTPSQYQELRVDGLSMAVPRLSANVPRGQYTPQMKILNMDGGGNIDSGFDTSGLWVEELRPFVNDRANAVTNVWSIRASPASNRYCFSPKEVSGFVATNATAYSWNPPTLNDGFLDYRVAGLHYMPDGSLTKGTYDLVLSSKVARCLYGFSSAPVSASISVIAADGSQVQLSLTTVSEKDGWLKLAAYGFTFSSPTIRVKLSQESANATSTEPTAAQAQEVVAPQVQKRVASRQTITCVNLKTGRAKRATGVTPKCPQGYRKR